jgi:hypothetical protein
MPRASQKMYISKENFFQACVIGHRAHSVKKKLIIHRWIGTIEAKIALHRTKKLKKRFQQLPTQLYFSATIGWKLNCPWSIFFHFIFDFYFNFFKVGQSRGLKLDATDIWKSIRFIILSIKWWKFNVRVSVGCMHMLVALHNKFSGYLNQFMFSFAKNNLGLMCACKFCYCI